MIPKIIKYENGNVVLDEEVMSISFLATIVKKRKDHLDILKYIYFMTKPDGPYCNVPEADKPAMIIKDIGGKFDPSDSLILEAIDRMENDFMKSPTRRFFISAKIGLEKAGDFLRNEEIRTGRDGNDKAYLGILKDVAKINRDFKVVEKDYQEEVRTLRGDQEAGYDE